MFATLAHSATLHAVFLSYNDDDKGDDGDRWKGNVEPLMRLFKENVANSEIEIVQIRCDSMTKSQVLGRINSLRGVQPDDTLLLYYSGHGAYNKDNLQYFWLRGVQMKNLSQDPDEQNLYHQTVIDALSAYHTRLVVLISDCCSSYDFEGPKRGIPAGIATEAQITAPLFDALFFKPAGLADVTSCSRGETATRFLFTGVLNTAMAASASQPLSWQQLVYRVRKATISDSKNHGQHPYAFALPRPRLGFRVSVRDGKLRAEEVSSPATDLGIKSGDVIVSVDGRETQSEDDFYDAVFESGKSSFQFEVRDGKTGEVRSIKLAPR
jgi:hypothetical protein